MIVSPSGEVAAASCCQPSLARARQARSAAADLNAVHRWIDPLDQHLHEPRLHCREELVPQRVELRECLARFVLRDVVLLDPPKPGASRWRAVGVACSLALWR